MPPRRLAVILAVALLYIVAGKAGLHFAFIHASASPIWPPTGLALAALLVLGADVWPAVLVGAFVVNVTTAGSVATSLGIAAGNTLEAIVGAWLVQRFARGPAAFERARDIFVFVGLAGLVSTALSATIGVTTLATAGYVAWSDYRPVWLTWWLGDVGGDLIVAPLLILWHRDRSLSVLRARPAETTLLAACVVTASFVVFGGALTVGLANAPIAFLVLPVLVWAAFRFGPRGTATVIAILSAVAIAGTLNGVGPFAVGSHNESLLILQGFMATVAVTMLPVASVVWERKRAEEERVRLLTHEREARAEAEAANRAKDQFLAMLGHELRNPLGAIGVAAHVLERVERGSPQADQALAVVGRQTRHLARLVDDLLDVSRVMAGKIPLERGPLDLGELVRRVVASLGGGERLAGHALSVETEHIWVLGDATRLEQVVSNLLENAAKYTPPGGRIAIAVYREEGAAVLTVTDSGVGMPPELVPKVFDLFVQGERSLQRPEGGLGIGLTLVRRLVDLHDGSVEASSDGVGRGSRFTVRLPRTPRPIEPPGRPATSESGARRRVLVVEDNDDSREMLRDLLRLLGHEVHEAADGVAGVDATLRLKPDVAIVDIGLPGIDGFEVARRIREAPSGHAVRLIALTGYGLPDDRARAFAAGYDSHLVKPIDLDTVRDVMK